MRILHTSDWHIGRHFHNVSLLEDQAVVLDQIIAIAEDRQVDVILVAGDLYDRSVPPASAVALLDDIFHRICNDLKIPVILIPGNHDGPERLSFGSRQMAGSGLNIIGSLGDIARPITVEDEHGKIAFYSIPYVEPATVRNVFGVDVSTHDEAISYILSQVIENHAPRQRSVVLAHLFLDGGITSESERPLSIGGLDQVSAEYFKFFDYAALGHLHGRQYKGAETICYSGSILKYSFSEVNHHKSVNLVEIDGQGNCVIEQVPLIPKRDMRVLEGFLAELLAQGQTDPHPDDYLLIRLLDTHAILDIMSKLREVYPNVLHLERPGLMASGKQHQPRRDHLKRGQMVMFKDFFQQVSGEALSTEQSEIIEKSLAEIDKGEVQSR